MSNLYLNNDVLFKNKALIFIDNSSKEIEKTKKILKKNWSDYFKGKKSFFQSIEGVELKILEYGAQDCIIFCDKNMPDVEGDKYLIELREKWGDDITLILHTGHPKPDSKKLLDAQNIYYKKKSNFNFILTQIESKLTMADEEVSLEQMFFKPDSEQNNLTEKKIVEPYSQKQIVDNDFESNSTMILNATVSHINRKTGIIELAIKKPSNNEDIINRRFSMSLFGKSQNIVINQVFQIIQSQTSNGINIKFKNTGEIEAPPKTASLWDEQTRDNFDDIERL